MPKNTCHDCGAKVGELHDWGCDTERCPLCGHQLLSCGCWYTVLGMDPDNLPKDIYNNGLSDKDEAKAVAIIEAAGRIPWTGKWPGEAECEEYGWFCYWNPKGAGDPSQNYGWVRCDKNHPKAQADLNRLSSDGVWNKDKKKWVPKPDSGEAPAIV